MTKKKNGYTTTLYRPCDSINTLINAYIRTTTSVTMPVPVKARDLREESRKPTAPRKKTATKNKCSDRNNGPSQGTQWFLSLEL